MARPRNDAHAVATKERVLRAAQEAFAAKGYAGATLAEIARGAGIRRPSLLYHFGSKEQLYESVLERSFDQLGSNIGAVSELPADPEGQLRAICSGFTQHLETHPWLSGLVLRELLDQQSGGRESLVAHLGPLVDLTAGLIQALCGERLRTGVDVRATVVTVGSSEVLRIASGDTAKALWPEGHSLGDQAASLLLTRS